MKNKTACVLTSVHSVFDTRIFRKQAKSLINAGYDVALIVQHTEKEVIDGITIIPLKKPNNRFKRIFSTTWQVYKKALKVDAGIYHFHDPELIPVGLLLRMKGKKVIYDVHEDVPKQIMSKEWIWKPIRGFVSKVTNAIEKIADKFLTAVVSATPSIGEKFSTDNIVVHNFPLLDELLLDDTIENENKDNIVTYVGGITSIRGIEEMVEAIGILAEDYQSKFLLAGKFSSKSLKERVKEMDGWSKVKFQGFINRGQVAENLAKAKAGLVLFHPLPNHIDAYPNKMFEYMSAGLPVIASDFPLWKEIIEGNECGITVDPQKPEEIAAAIKYIFDNPEEARQMGQNGRRAVEEKYNWSIEEKKLLELYKRILEE
ncbi:glycosyltransferase family 4 protein [Natroniella sp. ANB-PHB2]|uniref:glycosyltransferase family 4 protein n=1 Tax=Natroniella sp. ANB-PHB2 TaxID=3384444 RepID=UPI0038D37967